MKCIIPAKGWSRRVPQKNKKYFCGQPLIAWSIIQALSSRGVDSVYVSTDDEDIANITIGCGGDVIWREYEQKPDDGGGVPLYHALNELGLPDDEVFLSLMCTSPLRPPPMIDAMIDRFFEHGLEVMWALGDPHDLFVCKKLNETDYIPVLCVNGNEYLRDGCTTVIISAGLSRKNHEYHIEAFGDGETAVFESCNEGIIHPYFEKMGTRQSYYPVPMWQTWEVDTPDDFTISQILMEHFILKGQGVGQYRIYSNIKGKNHGMHNPG